MKPPERPDRRGPLSSVVPFTQSDGGVVKHPEFVVYDKSQTLVEYAIWYKHTPECLCTHCVTLSRCIIVRTLFNEQIELQMRGLDTIKDLKVKISNTSFIPEDEQKIIFKEEFLCDAHTLAHYEIATGSVLTLVVHSKMGRSVFCSMHKQTKESCMRVQDDKKTMLTTMTPMSLPELPPSLDLPCY